MYFSVRPYRILLSAGAQTLKRDVGLSGTDTQVMSFVVCSTLLKQQVAGLNISLQMFVIHWIISYPRCGLATLVTELVLYKNAPTNTFSELQYLCPLL